MRKRRPYGFGGALLRLPLRAVPKGSKLPVLTGPLRGARWISDSHVHGCWIGWYERDKQLLFKRSIQRGDVVFDIGANVGFYTLLASRLVGPDGRVIAFEPVPRNLGFLHEHIRINKLSNVQVLEAAVGERDGVASFDPSPGSAQGRLSEEGGLEVKVIGLDSAIERGELPNPNILKIDVEGAEAEVLRGAENLLRTSGPMVFLATHGTDVHRTCCQVLESHGYGIEPIDGRPLESSREILASKTA